MNHCIEARRAFYEARPRELRVAAFELRSSEDGAQGLEGYASLTNTPYPVTDWLGEYTETIERGAFGKALAERDDVRLLVNHDGIPIARTASATMFLTEDERGLHVDVPTLDNDSPLVQSVRSAMARGDLDQMSFAFKATRQSWNEDYSERTISEVRLFDVSVVTYPASAATSVKLRNDSIQPILRKVENGNRLTPLELETLQRALSLVPAETAPEADSTATDDRLAVRRHALALSRQRALEASLRRR